MHLDVEEQKERIRNHLLGSIWVKQQVVEQCLNSISMAADLIANTFRLGGKLLLCGNGGSAADCQHMASELVSRLTKAFDRPGLPAIALTTDTSYLTAFTNDCGYEGVFERQIQALGKPQDTLIGISTSGNSPNIIRAITKANELEIVTIALTGNKGGQLSGIAKQSIVVPSTDTQYIQESHLAIEHILCALVEQQLFG